ncbi:MAG: PilT/PilU family type 4a pilus ATPase [bacterium]
MAETNYKLTDLFRDAVKRKASDLHLVGGEPPVYRIDGELRVADSTPLTGELIRDLAFSLLNPLQASRFERFLELDFGYTMKGLNRFRINLRWQQGQVSLTARVIPGIIPQPDSIRFTETLYSLTHLLNGLVLVTGPARSGKSTTLATMVDIINTERSAHIITIEDPIEFLHTPKKSLIEQREVHLDTRTFANGIKYSLRQDPDILMVGEMRDMETMQAALTAAETGHLVFSTLHTRSAIECIDRIVDLFPPHQQHQVRSQLASVLRCVISQQLLPAARGGLVVAREILLNTSAVENLIRDNDLRQVYSQMQMGIREGMRTMNMAIDELKQLRLITEEVAQNRKGRELFDQRFY